MICLGQSYSVALCLAGWGRGQVAGTEVGGKREEVMTGICDSLVGSVPVVVTLFH